MKKPYIGITGFKIKEEIDNATNVFFENRQNNDYTLMLGFLVSQKRMVEYDVEGKRSPAAKELATLAAHCPNGTLPMMHYHTKNANGLYEEVKNVFGIEDMYDRGVCRAVQLNVVWPEINQLEKLMMTFPHLDIVLQLNHHMTEGISTKDLTKKVKTYDGLISYILVDPSGGLGKEFDMGQVKESLYALNYVLPKIRLGIAGGFSPENVKSRIMELKKSIVSDFCIDAEGRLRDESWLDKQKVTDYIRNSLEVL